MRTTTMKHVPHILADAFLTVGLVFLTLVLHQPAHGQVRPTKGRDCFGDPLPVGALTRLGTTRYTRCRSMAYSPDGKTVAIAGRREVCLWDVASRRLLHRLKNSDEVD